MMSSAFGLWISSFLGILSHPEVQGKLPRIDAPFRAAVVCGRLFMHLLRPGGEGTRERKEGSTFHLCWIIFLV